MRILVWHVHGSYLTSFVRGGHDYVLPVLPDRGPDGRGRARTWDWPASAREVAVDRLREEHLDVVVLQRPHEAALVERWTGRRVGRDLPAVYLEHNTPAGHAVATEHHVLRDPLLAGVPVVHVTHFNAMAWDCGDRPTTVVEHGIPDPGLRYEGTDPSLCVAVNEPVRRWRVAGSDLVLDLARTVPVSVYGMAADGLGALAEERGIPGLDRSRCHDLDQAQLHRAMARHRAYLHPYRWTSLGLALLEAMTLGMPVLALSTTEAPEAVPAAAGLVTNDVLALRAMARRLLADPDEARARGLEARAHALRRHSLTRFLLDWDRVLKEVTP
ncbi:glycosyltransferase [Fodinibacter luteus]|uniref:Glycosyltransferase n=1 Tax=Fodinibacter luteus TaxID=552064 RepID=A0ABP8KDP6_9MICO